MANERSDDDVARTVDDAVASLDMARDLLCANPDGSAQWEERKLLIDRELLRARVYLVRYGESGDEAERLLRDELSKGWA